MKTGVIIIFKLEIDDLLKGRLRELFNINSNIKFCLLNKTNNEEIQYFLSNIADQFENVSFVSLGKIKMNVSAKRAGARFMSNEFNLNLLGYIVQEQNIDFIKIIESFIKKQTEIDTNKIKKKITRRGQQILTRKILSIQDFVKNTNNLTPGLT